MKVLLPLYALFIGFGVLKLLKEKKGKLEITVFICLTSIGCMLWLCILLGIPLDSNQLIKLIFDRFIYQ